MEQESIAGRNAARKEIYSSNISGDSSCVPLSTPSALRARARNMSEASTAVPPSPSRYTTCEEDLLLKTEDRSSSLQTTSSGSTTPNSSNTPSIGINVSRLSNIQPPTSRSPKRRASESHVSSSTVRHTYDNAANWLVKTIGEEVTDKADHGSRSGAAEPKTVQDGVAVVEKADDAKQAAAKVEEKQHQVEASSPAPSKVEERPKSKSSRFKEKLLREGPLPGFLQLKRRGSFSLLEENLLEDKMPNPFAQDESNVIMPKSPREKLASDCGAKFGLGDLPTTASRKSQLLKTGIESLSPRVVPHRSRRHSTSHGEQRKSVSILDDNGLLTSLVEQRQSEQRKSVSIADDCKSPELVKPPIKPPGTGRPSFQRRYTTNCLSISDAPPSPSADSPKSPAMEFNRDSDKEPRSPRPPTSSKDSSRPKRVLRRGSTGAIKCLDSEPPPRYCTKGHPLSLMFVGTKSSGSACHSCSKCHREGILSPESIYRCHLCDYDLCESCAGHSCTSNNLLDQKLANLSMTAGVSCPSSSHENMARSTKKERRHSNADTRQISNAESDLGLKRHDPRPVSNAEATLGLLRRDSKTASYPPGRRNSATDQHTARPQRRSKTEHGLEQGAGICSLAQMWGKSQGG